MKEKKMKRKDNKNFYSIEVKTVEDGWVNKVKVSRKEDEMTTWKTIVAALFDVLEGMTYQIDPGVKERVLEDIGYDY